MTSEQIQAIARQIIATLTPRGRRVVEDYIEREEMAEHRPSPNYLWAGLRTSPVYRKLEGTKTALTMSSVECEVLLQVRIGLED